MNNTSRTAVYPMDVPLKASLARLTHGLSPAALALSFHDWFVHLLASPGKQAELASGAQQKVLQWLLEMQGVLKSHSEPEAQAPIDDKRFARKQWQALPYVASARAFLLAQQWWAEATTGVPGVSKHHEQVAAFMAR